MTIDWTLNVWSLVQLAAILVAFLASHVADRARLTRIEARMDRFERML